MATITVDVRDFKKLGLFLSSYSDKVLRQSCARSISRTLTTVRAQGTKEFRSAKLISMKASTMKTRIRAYNHAKSSQNVNEQFGEITISGKPESMARFFAKETAIGMRIGKSRGAFYSVGSTMYAVRVSSIGRQYMSEYSGTAFFLRKGGKKINAVFSRVGNKRLPIVKQTGPSLGRLAQDHGLLSQMSAIAQRRYSDEFERNLRFYSDRAIKRAQSTK